MKRIGNNKALELINKGAMLVDMRSPVAYRDRHVTGAVNLPLRNFLNTIQKMDRKHAIIIYSDSVTDDVLRQGNTYAENLGFSNIYITSYADMTGTGEPVRKGNYRGR